MKMTPSVEPEPLSELSPKVNCIYASVAVNPLPQCLDISLETGIVAFGASHAICILDPACQRVLETLVSHTARVNCVKWLRGDKQQQLISGSCDKTIRIWDQQSGGFSSSQTLVGFESAVNIVDSVCYQSGSFIRTLLAAGGSDATVRIWQRTNGQIISPFEPLVNVLPKTYSFSLGLHWALVPGTESSSPLLCVAGDDSNVHIYAEENTENNSGTFNKVTTLHGHDDWVRSIDSTIVNDKNDLLIASASQDSVVRLWRISNIVTDEGTEKTIKLKTNRFQLSLSEGSNTKQELGVTLESVLVGHEGAVYSVHWGKGGSCLLTASMDKTLILWKPDTVSGVWMDVARVGEVGGNTIGFYGAFVTDDCSMILGHDFQGAIHLWQLESGSWQPRPAIGGHFRSVEDIAWDPFGGGFGLMSTSLDQTTRLHAPLRSICPEFGQNWQELARPQIHGYDLACLATVPPGFQFVSGAEEKVVRTFLSPLSAIESVEALVGVDIGDRLKLVGDAAVGAAVPALGLSNKAIINESDKQNLDEERLIQPHPSEQFGKAQAFERVSTLSPPLEVDLLQNTLWPETQKLYGHGNEVFCLATSNDGRVLASACKAAKEDDAGIILWSRSHHLAKWQNSGTINGAHSLTVTQMAFSKSYSSRHLLLSVSRDRTLAVTSVVLKDLDGQHSLDFEVLMKTTKKTCIHSRVIWSCDWSHNDTYFLTASRDKKIVAWRSDTLDSGNILPTNFTPLTPLTLTEAVTAVAVAPPSIDSTSLSSTTTLHLIAAGLETGQIKLFHFNVEYCQFIPICNVPINISHHLPVKRLRFRPQRGRYSKKPVSGSSQDTFVTSNMAQLASCGEDHFVRLFEIYV